MVYLYERNKNGEVLMKTRSTVGFLLFKYINTDLAHRNLFQTLLGQVKQIRPNRLNSHLTFLLWSVQNWLSCGWDASSE